MNEDKKTVAEILETRMNKTPSELIQERCNDYYNEGVQACIEVVKQRLTNGEGTIAGMISSIGNRIISELEQLKKP